MTRREKKLKLLRLLYVEAGFASGLTPEHRMLRAQLKQSLIVIEANKRRLYWRDHTHDTYERTVIVHVPSSADPWSDQREW